MENKKISTKKNDLEEQGIVLCGLCQDMMKKIPNEGVNLTEREYNSLIVSLDFFSFEHEKKL